MTFRNVSPEVPDEEICSFYREIEGRVERIYLDIPTMGQGKIKIPSNARTVNIKLNNGMKFKNFYWLGGPLPEDNCRRVSV